MEVHKSESEMLVQACRALVGVVVVAVVVLVVVGVVVIVIILLSFLVHRSESEISSRLAALWWE